MRQIFTSPCDRIEYIWAASSLVSVALGLPFPWRRPSDEVARLLVLVILLQPKRVSLFGFFFDGC